MKRIVLALGGNALESATLPPGANSQYQIARQTAKSIAEFIACGHELIITHGNGPQVGRILQNNPDMPLDVCVAMSQGYIGYQLQQCLQNAVHGKDIKKGVATVTTQCLVCADDPAFENPTKPIGPRDNRRLVPSPVPTRILEIDIIKTLVASGDIVIACGGGGVPVITENDATKGVEAVIDKDLASAVLARDLDADMLVILTEVPNACLNFGRENETKIGKCTPAKIRKYIAEGHFASGSMLPKIKAALMFAESGKNRVAVISSLANAIDAVGQKVGTIICSK